MRLILTYTAAGRAIKHRKLKYLNNTPEMGHRDVRRIARRMLNCRAVHSAAEIIAGIAPAHMIDKAQISARGTNVIQNFAALAV